MTPGHLQALSIFAAVALVLVLLGLLVWSWDSFLNRNEHDPARVRAVMLLALALTTVLEFGLASAGTISAWVAWVSLVANLWGGLDAVLRFPGEHGLDSFFAVKEIALLIARSLAYSAGFPAARQHVGTFLAVLVFNIWLLPLLYLMALPLDPSERVVADDSYDVDLAVRVWQLAAFSAERRRCLATCQTWWNRRLVAACERSPLARLAARAASAQYRRSLRRAGRSV